MATVKTRFSPLHITSTVGNPYGAPPPPGITYSCGFHTGCDFPETGTGVVAPDLYSCVEDGEVVFTYTTATGSTPALGNRVQIRDNKTGHFYLYCHMLYGSIRVNVGDKVNTGTILR